LLWGTGPQMLQQSSATLSMHWRSQPCTRGKMVAARKLGGVCGASWVAPRTLLFRLKAFRRPDRSALCYSLSSCSPLLRCLGCAPCMTRPALFVQLSGLLSSCAPPHCGALPVVDITCTLRICCRSRGCPPCRRAVAGLWSTGFNLVLAWAVSSIELEYRSQGHWRCLTAVDLNRATATSNRGPCRPHR
jgi:hypothetical protein